ncbi:MAG TPA: hypothetical protein VHS81_08805 [Caulobacteraceae bacterium]|jgi:hypothetical protein|nr:hypothetical protein [Caulobacteraceae bacterium]
MDAKPVVFEDFADRVGETFTVLGLGEIAPVLTLTTADLLPIHPGGPAMRPPFSLIFDGPSDLLLLQRTYDIENAGGGQVTVFMVPVGRTAEAITYQVIFN